MATTYLTHTHGSAATLSTKGTFSCWVKRSAVTGEQVIFTGNDGSNRDFVRFESSSILRTRGCAGAWDLQTTQVFRDVNSWYHIVISVDTTQSTDSNRVKVYVNGSQITSFGTATYPSQNYALLGWSGNGKLQTLGRDGTNNAGYFDGALSHVHWIDGTAYDASAFGETDSTTGEWKAKTSPSVTYGNNGFFILKDGNGITDQSGKGNNFTVASGTLTNLKDNPDNVFATLNPLDKYWGHIVLTQGNNTFTQTSSSNSYAYTPSTLGFNAGKYYWEMKCVSGHSDNWYGTGITSSRCTADNNWLGNNSNDYGMYGYSYGGGLGASYTANTRTNQGLSFTAGDIIGVAVDCDNLAIYFSKNGTWMSNASSVQGVPTSGSSKTGSFFTITAPSSTSLGFYFPALCYYDAQNVVQQINFGNGYFGTTAITTNSGNGYSGAEGSSKFNYTVPTGYSALSTKGLNE